MRTWFLAVTAASDVLRLVIERASAVVITETQIASNGLTTCRAVHKTATSRLLKKSFCEALGV